MAEDSKFNDALHGAGRKVKKWYQEIGFAGLVGGATVFGVDAVVNTPATEDNINLAAAHAVDALPGSEKFTPVQVEVNFQEELAKLNHKRNEISGKYVVETVKAGAEAAVGIAAAGAAVAAGAGAVGSLNRRREKKLVPEIGG